MLWGFESLFSPLSSAVGSFLAMSSDQASSDPSPNKESKEEALASDAAYVSKDAAVQVAEATAPPAAASAATTESATPQAAVRETTGESAVSAAGSSTAGDATMAQVLSAVESLTSVFGFDSEVASAAVEAVGKK